MRSSSAARPSGPRTLAERSVTAFLAILSAVLVGAADFTGGFASRGSPPLRVAALAQMVGLPFAFVLALAYGSERVGSGDAAWSLASGLAVACGFAFFYTAMGRGLISVVAPLAAVTGAVVPVVYAVGRGERPGGVATAGMALALAAVAVVSIAPSDPRQRHVAITPGIVALSLAAGLWFGLFYVFFAQISAAAGMWPIALERIAAALVLLAIAGALTRGPLELPSRLWRLAVVIGALEVAATVPLLLALQRGPVAIASVLASLYPVTTVLLAALVLRERMSRFQLAGVVLAFAAVTMVSSS